MSMSVEQKVGLFFLVSLIVLAVLIERVEEWKPFEDQFSYRAYFNSSIGLKVGDPVKIAGVSVGKVKAIGLEESQVRVDFYVNQADSVREDSIAQVRQTNMLGGIFLGLDFGSMEGKVMPPGSKVITKGGTNIDELITNLDRNQERVLRPLGELVDESKEPLAETIRRLEQIVIKVDEGQGTLGRLVNNPSLYDEMAAMSKRLNRLLARVENGEGTLGKLASDPSLYENLNKTMINLEDLTEQLKSGQGTLGKLIKDEQLYNEAKETFANLNKITTKVNAGEGSLGKMLHDDALYDNVSGSMARINSIAAKIDEGEGTLGRLVNEDDLYRDAKTTLHKVEKSVDGISDTGPLSALGVVLGTLF